MNLLLNIIYICALSISINNQPSAPETESYMVHLDKPFYITGERVFFKLYYPEVKENVAIRVLLLNAGNEVVQDFFSLSENSSHLSGSLTIPYNYISGQYRLVFNSNVKLPSGEKELALAQISFPVYNDLSVNKLEVSKPSIDNTGSSGITNSLDIEASTNQSQYFPRQNVDLKLNIKNKDGLSASDVDISVAVVNKSITSTIKSGLEFVNIGQTFNENVAEYLSDDVYVKGTVYNRSDRPVQLNIIGAYAEQYKSMQYTKSNKEGEFTMEFDNLAGQQEVQFLPYEKEIRDFKIVMHSPILPTSEGSADLFITEDILEVLEDSRKRKKLNQYFQIEDLGKSNLSKKASDDDEYSDIKFVVSEYEKFEQLYDFFNELITPLQFKKVQGRMVATMNNPKSTRAVTTVLAGNPLFIIDGKVTRNADYAGQLPLSNVETIELIYDPETLRKRYNVMGISGVVLVNTITPIFDFPKTDSDDLFKITGNQGQMEFNTFKTEQAEENYPYFRSTVYWNPDISTNANGIAQLSFDHPDDRGEFSIVIIAQDGEGNRGMKVIDYLITGRNSK